MVEEEGTGFPPDLPFSAYLGVKPHRKGYDKLSEGNGYNR